MYVASPYEHKLADGKLILTIWSCALDVVPSFRTAGTGWAGNTTFLNEEERKYVAPEGYVFCGILVNVKNKGQSTTLDLNGTSLKTEKGETCRPFYAIMEVQLKPITESDLHLNPEVNEKGAAFPEEMPATKKQVLLKIWYAIPVGDKPASLDFFSTPVALSVYTKK